MIVLDTHAWLWWVTGSSRLPARLRRRLDRATALGVCAVSCWEVSMLVVRNRLKLDRSTRVWVAQALSLPGVELVPLDAEVAVAAADLPEFGGDPADRMIVATARHHDANLATADERIADSNLVPIVW